MDYPNPYPFVRFVRDVVEHEENMGNVDLEISVNLRRVGNVEDVTKYTRTPDVVWAPYAPLQSIKGLLRAHRKPLAERFAI